MLQSSSPSLEAGGRFPSTQICNASVMHGKGIGLPPEVVNKAIEGPGRQHAGVQPGKPPVEVAAAPKVGHEGPARQGMQRQLNQPSCGSWSWVCACCLYLRDEPYVRGSSYQLALAQGPGSILKSNQKLFDREAYFFCSLIST